MQECGVDKLFGVLLKSRGLSARQPMQGNGMGQREEKDPRWYELPVRFQAAAR
jgi:hypothetical protein